MDNTINAREMGKLIRQLRMQHGWSVSECAEKCHISNTYLSEIERGAKIPKMETFVYILNVLEASADYVLQDSLLAGYRPKSSMLENKLNRLSAPQKRQVLQAVDALVDSFSKP
ncbi:MAG: helix-turn-helix domain-containing protein [Intestinibacillus sp.]